MVYIVGRSSALCTCIPQRVKWETLSLEQAEDRKPTHEPLARGDGRPFTEMRYRMQLIHEIGMNKARVAISPYSDQHNYEK